MYTSPPNPQSTLTPSDLLTQFRIRTVAEILDAAFRAYRRHFFTFLLIIVFIAIPIQLLSYAADIFILGRYEQPTFSNLSSTGRLSSSLSTSNVTSQVATIKDSIETYLLFFAQWALTSVLVSSVFGGVVTLRSAYNSLASNFGRVFGLIGLHALITIAIYSPLLLILALMVAGNGAGSSSVVILLGCIAPFVAIANLIVDVRIKLALPAAVVEDLSPREAIRRSFNLTHNYWWRTVALITVLNLLSTVIAAGPAAIISALLGFGLQDIYATVAVSRLVTILTNVFFAPIEMGAIAFYYFDQRVRREGYDLETAIERRYEEGAYGEPPSPPAYEYDPTASYSTYGQPHLGYAYSPLDNSNVPRPTYPSYYNEPTQNEPSRVRRILPQGIKNTPDLPAPTEADA